MLGSTTSASNPGSSVGSAVVTLVRGSTFAIVEADGEIRGPGARGAFASDRRILSRLVVAIDGERPEPLAQSQDEGETAVFIGRAGAEDGRSLLLVRRLEVQEGGLDVELRVENPTRRPRRATLHAVVQSDLASIFDVKGGLPAPPAATATLADGAVVLARQGLPLEVEVRGTPQPSARVDPHACVAVLVWDLDVPACGVVRCHLAARVADDAGRPASAGARPLPAWEGHRLAVESDVPGLDEAVARSLEDLDTLRIHDDELSEEPVLAAGAPWYMTLFGRDAVIASLLALPADPGLARSTALALARLQGTRSVPGTEEEPGRILHEVRRGSSAVPLFEHGPVYYGTVDATPLFVILVAELHRFGMPLAELVPLLPAVDAALGWLAGPGDADGDGFVEYRRKTAGGLVNQGWKDSWDSIAFPDGPLAVPPIALAEVQGYAYAAWRGGAELAAAAGDAALARARRRRATALRRRFREAFVGPDGAVAIALDGAKRRVDAVASNTGHCLWTGILAPDDAATAARRLVQDDLWSGWGIRTLATGMARFDPLAYHNGTVWAHDTAICVAGLRRAGADDGAARVARGLLDACSAFGGRLPELFAGLARDDFPAPVPYPAACAPQAWASAAPILLVRTLLGLDVVRGRIRLAPLPGVGRLVVDGLWAGGRRVRVRVRNGRARIEEGPPSGLPARRGG